MSDSPAVAGRRSWAQDNHPERVVLKILGWAVGIIFLIGLLVVIGVFDLIF